MRSQIKSLIFSLYSAKSVREVCGAYKSGSKFKKLISKFDLQKLNKILISQVRFFDCIIIFRSTKMFAQIAYLRLCALMSGFGLGLLLYCQAIVPVLLRAPISQNVKAVSKPESKLTDQELNLKLLAPKMIFQEYNYRTFYSPSCLSQETAKERSSSQATTHDGGFTLFL